MDLVGATEDLEVSSEGVAMEVVILDKEEEEEGVVGVDIKTCQILCIDSLKMHAMCFSKMFICTQKVNPFSI